MKDSDPNDVDSEEEDLDADLGIIGAATEKKKKSDNPEKIEVNFDELEDEDDQECLLDYNTPSGQPSQQQHQPSGLLDQENS